MHKLTNLVQQPLTSIWATIPLRLDKMHPKSVSSIFLLGPVQPQELTMETTDSPDKQLLELMESQEDVSVFPRDLLYIS